MSQLFFSRSQSQNFETPGWEPLKNDSINQFQLVSQIPILEQMQNQQKYDSQIVKITKRKSNRQEAQRSLRQSKGLNIPKTSSLNGPKTSSFNVHKMPSFSKIDKKNLLQSKQRSSLAQNQVYQIMQRTFSMFSKPLIDLNQFLYSLICLGIEIESQKRFQHFKNCFQSIKKVNSQDEIDFQQFSKISRKLVKQQRFIVNSNINNIEQCFYYMLEEGNQLKSLNFSEFQHFKSSVNNLDSQKKYLSKNSVFKLIKYLNLNQQFSQDDVDNIFIFLDEDQKGYLSFQNVVQALCLNKIFN